ncbi:methyltransferase [Lewinellaceae bacterium SD302]|nr:methyltransferase [Lewinellaceae bacterium SD302]
MNHSTTLRDYRIGQLTVHLETIDDTESLLDDLIERGPADPDYQDEVLPYWADLWHSALGLAESMVERSDELRGKKVIELGCGLGLPGIAAVMLGAEVTFTDYVADALDFARLNLEHNVPEHNARFMELDWRKPALKETFDFVLAADVAYEKRFFKPLYSTIRGLLAPNGQCWLSEPGRPIAREFLSGFTDHGFQEIWRTNKVASLDGVKRTVSIRAVG